MHFPLTKARKISNPAEAEREKEGQTDRLSSKASSITFSTTPPDYVDLEWYSEWLSRRFHLIPKSTKSCVTSVTDVLHCIVHDGQRPSSTYTLEGMAVALIEHGLIHSPNEATALEAARLMVFLALGWRSMLFEPMAEAVPSKWLEISDVLDGSSSTTFASTTIHFPRFTTTLPDLLVGFGLMLPQKNLCLSMDEDTQDAFRETLIVTPASLNFSLLSNLLGIRIKWIDVMAPHMEFDQATDTLFLYRYPSYCVASMREHAENRDFGTLYSMASTDCRNARWATEDDITHFLEEILLSYRLLFGQDQPSSKKFRSIDVFQPSLETSDDLLAKICSRKRPEIYGLPPDREVYRLDRDFPILRERIALLQQRLSGVKPRGWMSLWRDKRDMAQWWTFWAVIFFGGFGMVIGILQVVLQALQLYS